MAYFICEKQGRCCPHEFYNSIEQAITDSEDGVPCDHLIEVAPVRHGRWVDRIVDENEVIQPWMERYYCSECLEGGNQSWFKFCPNCGAKMDGCDGNSDMA